MDGGIFGLFFGTKPFYGIDRDTQASLTGLKLGRCFPETVVVLRRKIYRVATVGARTSCLVCLVSGLNTDSSRDRIVAAENIESVGCALVGFDNNQNLPRNKVGQAGNFIPR